ncbi:MAG: SLC13 family permease [Alphaproteobacteria bacterium]
MIGLIAGPVAFLILFLMVPVPAGLSTTAWSVGCVAVLMAVWWFSQAIPLAATALLPPVLFPFLGVSTIGDAISPFAHPLIFLFLGGFVVALTVERWNLHRRLALAVIAFVGRGTNRITAGFMLATAGLSMWVSNTATTLMMLPIALSVIDLTTNSGGSAADKDRFARGLLIAVAYAASIGGIATLIGTPPNAVLAAYMSSAQGVHIGFAGWMMIGTPVAAVLLVVAWGLICRVFFPVGYIAVFTIKDALAEQSAGLGPMRGGERLSALLLSGLALMWLAQPVLSGYMPITDTGIALGAAILAFCIPVNLKERVFLMDWKHARKLPWEILLLFGGGLSLAAAITTSGLSLWIGEGFAGLGGDSLIAAVLMIVLAIVFLTELASNTATAAIFIPVAVTLADGYGVDALIFGAPAALAASCAFMMPVATPPNAIVFGSGRLNVQNMCGVGLILNLIAAGAISVAAVYLLPLMPSV